MAEALQDLRRRVDKVTDQNSLAKFFKSGAPIA
jgi:hypothetical protein